MRIGVICVAWLLGSTVFMYGAEQGGNKEETIARWHFAGAKQLANQKDAQALAEIVALPETKALRDAALDAFAARVAERFSKGDTNASAQITTLVRPLLPDLVDSESRFDLSARGAQDADWFLALKLGPERIDVWSKNLTALAKAARMEVTPGDSDTRWKAAREDYRLSFSPEKDWLLLQGGFGSSQGESQRAHDAIQQRPAREVLTLAVNFPKIGEIWNAERFQHAPKLDLRVTPRNGMLRSEMAVEYPRSLNINPEPWNIPTNLLQEPLIGFTAIQGLHDRLAKSERFRELGAEKTPNQAFLWSESITPFTVFAAMDVGNSAEVVSNIVSGVVPKLKEKNMGGTFLVVTNHPAVLWRGLPVIVPFVEAANDGKSPFLVAGLFPVNTPHPKPAPAELFAQLEKKDLVYYDWEVTPERLKQWRPIWQAMQILRGKFFMPSVSDKWIEAMIPKLGNTVTEATLTKPNRLELVRQSQCGLTALELVFLAHALDPSDIVERHEPAPGTPRKSPARKGPAAKPTAHPQH